MTKPVIQRILAPVELLRQEPPKMLYAIQLAAQLHAELILVAVLDTAAAASLVTRHQVQHSRQESFNEVLVRDAKAILQKVVDEAAAQGVKAWGHALVSEDVEELILKEAVTQKVDLILVRSHGRTGISKALLGSTAGDILKAAPCPVLVARAQL